LLLIAFKSNHSFTDTITTMTTTQYIENINKRYKLGNATEHTFRGDLQQLIEDLVPGIRATNEPKRQSCGAPDYILTKKDIPIGFIEAKDIGDPDLDGQKKTGNKEQFDRYKSSLSNLIFTDYLNFHFYRDGAFLMKISIGEVTEKGIKPIPENFERFEQYIKDFCLYIGQTIKSSKKLAQMMAGKARLLSEVIEKALVSDEQNSENSTLQDQMSAFKQILIHDITPKGFADVYAQTIAYGMFAARTNDPTLTTFNRQEAFELIPKSNPFLKKLFGYIAGLEVDDRIKWIVDDLVSIFLACNVEEMLKNYGKNSKMEDPIIHFYEDFLSEYDPKLRKARGVWYTPAPVVNFIVRAVDEILKTEFDMPQGLADTSKTKIKVNVQGKMVDQEVHKVQILDPATGTGTFLAEVIKLIYQKFEGQQGIWSNFVENQLLPRLNGFEILMASYAMAHLKLDLLLKETGFKATKDQRFRVYLTNSLEEYHQDTGTLFANWLSSEANEANHIKRDTPVMCIIGNPPYSGISSNNGEWISKLIEDYKYIDGVHFNERKHWLNDDYVKFIRYGQHFIEKNGSGVLAFINPHGFLDNPTFRGMRWNLLKTYDKIYTIDLHGNSKKKEKAPDGSIDENVFDIMQGVSINFFIKTGKKKEKELGQVFHFDLLGKREFKYNFLSDKSLKVVNFEKLSPEKPFLLFVERNINGGIQYYQGFGVNDFFTINSVGCVSANDGLNFSFSIEEQINKISDLITMQEHLWRLKYKRPKDARDWTYLTALKDAQNNNLNSNYVKASYRPFDDRWSLYTSNSRGLYSSPQPKVMSHLLKYDNLGLIIGRQGQVVGSMPWNLSFITNTITDFNMFYRGGGMLFPLYFYPTIKDKQTTVNSSKRTPNLNLEIVHQVAEKIGLTFTNEKEETENTFAPIDILDYIYAVLHSPTYREKYKEFLKIDFPRLPYPKDQETFWELVKLGGEIRQIHLLDSPILNKTQIQYPIDGTHEVIKPIYENGKVYINETQYFDHVPEVAWNFYIGGYQPAQKWLKDRKGRTLNYEDIVHYQKIIIALCETDRLMKEIDKIEIE